MNQRGERAGCICFLREGKRRESYRVQEELQMVIRASLRLFSVPVQLFHVANMDIYVRNPIEYGPSKLNRPRLSIFWCLP
jgi:hypothetical protein